jgi:hypothetical protein
MKIEKLAKGVYEELLKREATTGELVEGFDLPYEPILEAIEELKKQGKITKVVRGEVCGMARLERRRAAA